MGKLVRRTLEGFDTLVEWSSEDPTSLEAAQEALKRELDGGYTAVLADDDNETVTQLPPDAELVILTIPMGGG